MVPIGAEHASELWEIHRDEGVARWFPMNREQALRFAERMESLWRDHGVDKWLAYERSTGALSSGGASLPGPWSRARGAWR